MNSTISISEAQQHLGEIADRALQGEQIVIMRGSRLLVLQQLEMPEPVPMPPQGYFNDCYDSVAAHESNQLHSDQKRSQSGLLPWLEGVF